MFCWSFTFLPDQVDVWLEKLDTLDATRLVITRTPGRQRQTIAYYTASKREAAALQNAHGGKVAPVDKTWMTPSKPHPPIRIRDQFLIVENGATPPDPREIIIPAGMAFGTGDHPTTASCLRLLCDEARARGPVRSLLDVGTGSGVLAIAAKKLGAKVVAAFDYDAVAIRAARENARLNQVRGIRWAVDDLLQFTPERVHAVVTANIFSELFLAAWPRLAPAVEPGGAFLLSGILRFQEVECRSAFEKAGFTVERTVRLGKWVTLLARHNLHGKRLALA